MCPPACAPVGVPAQGVSNAQDAPPRPEHFHDYANQAAAKGRRPLRPSLRARCVRRGHGRAAGQPAHPRGPHARDHRAREPRAPRRLRRGPVHGRRRGDPHADARRAAARGRRLRAAATRGLRGADVLPADRPRRPREARGPAGADRARRGPAAARVARRARLPRAHRGGRGRLPAGHPAAVRRHRGRRRRATARRSSASCT